MKVSSIALVVVGILAVTAAGPTENMIDKATGDLISKLRQEVLTSGTEFDPLTFTYFHWMLHSDYYVKVTGGKVKSFDIEISKGLSLARNGKKLVVQVPIAIEHLTLEHEIECLMDMGDGVYNVNGTIASSVTAVIQLDVAPASSGTCTGEVASIDVIPTDPGYELDMSHLGYLATMNHWCASATRFEATDGLKKNFKTNFPSAMVKFLASHLTTVLKDFNLC